MRLLPLLLLAACATTHQEDKELPLQRKLRQCYVESDSYTGMAGEVQGAMTLDVIVNPEGKVTSARIKKSDFKDPNLHACVLAMLKQATIENKTGKTMEIVRPVKFEAVRR